MKQVFDEIVLNTKGSGLYDFTNQTKNFANKNKLLNGKPMMVFATTDQRQITINPSFHTFTITERKRGQ